MSLLTVGIPREIKSNEKRAGLTPRGVRSLREAGIKVLVEKGAGEGSGYSDPEYREAGAELTDHASDLYRNSELIQKVKEPVRAEWDLLTPDMVLCCFLHLASPEQRGLVDTLLQKHVVAIGFETVAKGGQTICLKPMSEIAGTLVAFYADFIRRTVQVQNGVLRYPPDFMKSLEWLAARYPELPGDSSPVKAVVFGAGGAGQRAAETLLRMNGEVDLVEKNEVRRVALRARFQKYGSRIRIWDPQENLGKKLSEAEVWIGCVHVLGERAPRVLSSEDLQKFSSTLPKLIMDVAVDQGGNFPETHSTPYDEPLYLDAFGNLRFGVTNIPSLSGRGASEALEAATLPYTLALAENWKQALIQFSELRSGLQIFSGGVVNEGVARSHQLVLRPFAPADLAAR